MSDYIDITRFLYIIRLNVGDGFAIRFTLTCFVSSKKEGYHGCDSRRKKTFRGHFRYYS